MESGEAAAWLIENYPITNPDYGTAFVLLGARTWLRWDQITLARYYLQKMPFSSSRPYEVFCSFMALPLFIRVITEQLPKPAPDANLIRYHLEPLLNAAARSDGDHEKVKTLLDALR